MTSLPTHLAFAAPRSAARANPTPMPAPSGIGIGYGSGGAVGFDSVRAA